MRIRIWHLIVLAGLCVASVEAQNAHAEPPVKKRRHPKYQPAVLQVVTNFQKAEVTVNGLSYPSYVEPGEPEGMVLPAGGPYDVRVTYDGSVKAYQIYLRPHETRLLIVEIPGFAGTVPAAPRPVAAARPVEEKKEENAESGKVTVYSKPPGTIMIDGKNLGEKTPGTVDVDNGRHEVQVQYEGGQVSEKKIVRVRDGSRIKLFFRERTE